MTGLQPIAKANHQRENDCLDDELRQKEAVDSEFTKKGKQEMNDKMDMKRQWQSIPSRVYNCKPLL